MFRLDDGRPSGAHVHCLRNEQCTCTYDLKYKFLLDGNAFHVRSGPGQTTKSS